ncbi:hypothetical protein Salat_2926500 [Sesamum alatum]|uniref:3'-5' exonuclease domain-containing protein n=1 Tax=Sesamum alatum TaxID=300844 RepID=A0AAE1XJ84_9LAMI|nr:hypothetical protein Salat_2926500 [Sesamum alatum]
MKISIRDHKVPFEPYELYDVIVDDEEIETLVTHDPDMVSEWINDTKTFNQCRLHRLIVGLDVEWRPPSSSSSCCFDPIATIQLCVATSCLIFQILYTSKLPRRLRKFLADPDYTFVGVGVKHDARRLWNYCGLEVSNTRDLRSWAAKELDKKELHGAGLKDLVREVLGEDMKKPKNVTLSRWDNRVLSRDQVVYACLDAYFSFEIGRRLSAWY